MIQIRLHGRGGQGVVTAAELIAIAAFKDGKISQAFPYFGVERTGAPIEAYARIDDKEIRTHEQVYEPDVIVVIDPTLLKIIDVARGANPKTKIIINTDEDKSKIRLNISPENIYTVGATKIALEIFGKNLANTVILGAFAKDSGLITLKGLEEAIKEKFKGKGKEVVSKNIKAIETTYKT